MRIEKSFFLFYPREQVSFHETTPAKYLQQYSKSTLSDVSYFQRMKHCMANFFKNIWLWIKWLFCCIRFIEKSKVSLDLMNVWETTKFFFENSKSSNILLALETAVKNTCDYPPSNTFIKHEPGLLYPVSYTEIFVENNDLIDTALNLKDEGLNPLVLNPAHATLPGGCYRTAIDIEEEICRRSGLAFALDPKLKMQKKEFYPLVDNQVIYSPNVPIIRKGIDKQYPFLKHPKCLSFVTSAPLDSPELTTENTYKNPHDLEKMQQRIYAQLRTARYQNHDSLVLCPFGCGSFGNPPSLIVKMYLEVIKNFFPKNFKTIVFAIPKYQFVYEKQDLDCALTFSQTIKNYNAKNLS